MLSFCNVIFLSQKKDKLVNQFIVFNSLLNNPFLYTIKIVNSTFMTIFRVMENIQNYMMKKNSLKFQKNLKTLFACFVKTIPQDVK